MIDERSNSFDEPGNHTEIFHQRLVRGSGEELEGNTRRSIHGNATTTLRLRASVVRSWYPPTLKRSNSIGGTDVKFTVLFG